MAKLIPLPEFKKMVREKRRHMIEMLTAGGDLPDVTVASAIPEDWTSILMDKVADILLELRRTDPDWEEHANRSVIHDLAMVAAIAEEWAAQIRKELEP